METIRKSGLRYREEAFNKKRISTILKENRCQRMEKNKEAEIYSSLKNGIDPFFKERRSLLRIL